MKARKYLVHRCREKRVNRKKKENGENIFFKAVADRFRVT